ncbi:MAG: CaiB/BaiF CoA transferase family protein [Alphaproteobacteria bacterium]|tara:strand:+ start:872 stop:2095 length:1224 start_codon:yes stop_codon:yes gene_type:complete
MSGPLKGIKVVDFTRVLAGPHFTKMLSDMGAEVIKIEHPETGDLARLGSPISGNFSHYFVQQNIGKKCISLDLNKDEGREIVRKLCVEADIIAENFRPGTLGAFDLDYDSIKLLNKKAVYVSISGYGQHGPLRGRAAFAPTVHAECGTAHTKFKHIGTALDDFSNMQSDFSHADVYTGLEAAVSCLAALHNAEKTGLGQHIDVSLAATMIAVNERAHAELAGMDDRDDEPFALSAPDSPYIKLSNGDIAVIAASPILGVVFSRYARMMRRLDLLENPLFKTAKLRRKNFKILMKEVNDWASTFRSIEDLEAQVGEVGLAVGKLNSMKDFAEGEWGSHWGAVRDVEDGEGGIIKIPGLPWKFSKTNCSPGDHMATRGMDNISILKNLGYSDEEIKDFYNAEVIAEGKF